MIPIGIPRDNARVWVSDGIVKLTEEAEQWLESNVGPREFRNLDQPEYHPLRDHWIILNSYHHLFTSQATRIFFSNPAHAVLFKLTFL